MVKKSIQTIQYRSKRNSKNEKKKKQNLEFFKAQKFKIKEFVDELINEYDFIQVTGNQIKIVLPKNFDLSKNYERTINVINAFRKVTDFQSKINSTILAGIDFENMEYISTSASLILIAELDVWNRNCDVKLRALVQSWHDDVLNHFSQIGFFDLIECSTGNNEIPQQSTIKFLSGNTIDQKNTGQVIKGIRNKIEDLVGGGIHKQRLYESLNESLLNVSYHAYSDSSNFKMWWLTASFDAKKKRLRVAFCDRGFTIPESMKDTEKGSTILKMLGKTSKHSDRIKAAMKGVSSTNMPNRGKGLPFLNNFIQASKYGKLHIISGKGYYMFDNKMNIEKTKERDTYYQGTLITWAISVE